MRVSRIYTADELNVGQLLQLSREASNHLSRVLRLKVGNPVVLFNGDGVDYHGVIETIDRNRSVSIFKPVNLKTLNHRCISIFTKVFPVVTRWI